MMAMAIMGSLYDMTLLAGALGHNCLFSYATPALSVSLVSSGGWFLEIGQDGDQQAGKDR